MKKLSVKQIDDILKIHPQFKEVYGPYCRQGGRDIVVLYDGKRRSARKVVEKTACCVFCGEVFEMSRNQITKRAKNKPGPFCSKSCVTKSMHQKCFMVQDRKVIYNK